MKRKSTIVVLATSGILGLLTGYAVRDATPSGEASDRFTEPAGASPFEGRSDRRPVGEIAELSRTLELLEGPLRWLHLVSAIEDASLDDLLRIAALLHGDEIALEILAHHWVESDPQHMFESLRKQSRLQSTSGVRRTTHKLARHLFERWPRIDPDAVIAALSVPNGIVGQHVYRTRVFDVMVAQDPERGIGLISKWSIVNTAPRQDRIRKWAAKDPQKAAEVVLANPFGAGAETSARVIAKLWAEKDVQAAMKFTMSRQDRLSLRMQEIMMNAWAKRDFDKASLWLAQQEDPSLLSRLTPHLVEAWAQGDTENALAWCKENLSGVRLVRAFESLAKGAAAKDVKSAAAMVAGLTQSPARTRAAVAIAKEWFPTSQPSAKKVTPEAIDWLRDLNDLHAQGEVLKAISWGWSTQDRNGLKDFLSSPHAAEAPDRTFYPVADDWAKSNPELAFQWAETLPSGRSERIAVRVFETWFGQQPDSATSWLRALPQSDHRRPMLIRNFAQNTAYAPEAVALQRMEAFKPDDIETIKSLGIPKEKMQRFLDVLEQDE